MAQTLALIDYGSGNIRSAAKALEKAAGQMDVPCRILVTDRASDVRGADRIVLPGVGAFGDCRDGIARLQDMAPALDEAARTKPFLGICVGMQLMATRGLEHGEHRGFDWIGGEVVPLNPADTSLKIPHMGWNLLELTSAGRAHPVLKGLDEGQHVYFVHSFQMKLTDPKSLLATVGYGGPVTAIIGRDNLIGTQFHPEKSQRVGLQLLRNFLEWMP